MSGLDDIQRDLEYAAGTGANRLREQTLSRGRTLADLGAALGHSPGLSQLAGADSHAVHAEGTQLPLEQVVGEMAHELADGGVDLAKGSR